MNMHKNDIQEMLTNYYYMLDEYYSDGVKKYNVTLNEIENRCQYLEDLLSYLYTTKKDTIEVNVDKIHFGGV